MKVFISQPMRGKSSEVILAERKLIIERIKESYGDNTEVLDSYASDFNESEMKNSPVKYLAKSIDVLAEADLAFFASGWKGARGCQLEYDIARAYGIKIAGDSC